MRLFGFTPSAFIAATVHAADNAPAWQHFDRNRVGASSNWCRVNQYRREYPRLQRFAPQLPYSSLQHIQERVVYVNVCTFPLTLSPQTRTHLAGPFARALAMWRRNSPSGDTLPPFFTSSSSMSCSAVSPRVMWRRRSARRGDQHRPRPQHWYSQHLLLRRRRPRPLRPPRRAAASSCSACCHEGGLPAPCGFGSPRGTRRTQSGARASHESRGTTPGAAPPKTRRSCESTSRLQKAPRRPLDQYS